MANPEVPRQERCDYYVYILFRRNGLPFYVGKGRACRISGTRNLKRYRGTHKGHIIEAAARLGLETPAVKVSEGLTHIAACAVETALIAAIGRRPNGPLVNQTAGGDGAKDIDAEVRAKISISKKGGKHTAESRANMSRAHKGLPGRPHTKESREKISLAHLGKRGPSPSPEVRAKLRAANIGKKQPFDAIEKTARANRGKKRTAESRMKMRLSAIARWNRRTHGQFTLPLAQRQAD